MVAKARRILNAPPRYLAQVKTDCLLTTQRLPKRLCGAAAGAGGAAPPGRRAGLPRGRDEAVAGQQQGAAHKAERPKQRRWRLRERARRCTWCPRRTAPRRTGLGADGRPLGAQVRARGQRAKAGLAGGGALGGPGLRGAERRRTVPAAGRLPAVAGRWTPGPLEPAS